MYLLILILCNSYLNNQNFPYSYEESNKFESNDEKYNFQEIDILSYNVWALPVWMPQSGIGNRYERISSHLLQSDHDIICLQESFNKRFRKKLIEKLGNRYYHTDNHLCSQNIFGPVRRDCHGGLMTLSKYPIISEEFHEYERNEEMRFEEKIGHKGFLVSIIDCPGQVMAIINTHLYAGPYSDDETQRLHQIKQIHKFLQCNSLLNQMPVFLIGDLNINHPDIVNAPKSKVYQFIINEMRFTDFAPNLNENYYTIDYSRNMYSGNNNGKQKLDYCMLRSVESFQCTVMTQEAIYADQQANSDHLGWQTIICLDNNMNEISWSE